MVFGGGPEAAFWGPSLQEPHFLSQLGRAGKSHFLFVNSGHMLLAFLPPTLPGLCHFGGELEPGQGSWGRSGQDSPPQACWATFQARGDPPERASGVRTEFLGLTQPWLIFKGTARLEQRGPEDSPHQMSVELGLWSTQ